MVLYVVSHRAGLACCLQLDYFCMLSFCFVRLFVSKYKNKPALVASASLTLVFVGLCRVCTFVQVRSSLSLLNFDDFLVGDTSFRVAGCSTYRGRDEERILSAIRLLSGVIGSM